MKSKRALPIRLLTHNIRYATTSPSKGEDYWDVRKSRMLSELRFSTTHCAESFICLQEALHGQLVDILSGLNHDNEDQWRYIGVGRDDGHEGGEYSPIIYQPAVWNLLEWKTKWLSPTPDRPSIGWDAACIRILTIGVFQHRESRKKVVAMSTHLDHVGPVSRVESAKIILGQTAEYKDQADGIFLAGDFNSPPSTEAYKLMTSDESLMFDLRDKVSAEERYGHDLTFSGFKGKPDNRIDFLFLEKSTTVKQPWKVKNYAVLENQFEDGIYNSDHRAVVGDVELR